MLGLALVLVALLSLSHWLMQPFYGFATSLLSLSWLGWALLAVLLWLFAGGRRSP
jgi:hypothetical protein